MLELRLSAREGEVPQAAAFALQEGGQLGYRVKKSNQAIADRVRKESNLFPSFHGQ